MASFLESDSDMTEIYTAGSSNTDSSSDDNSESSSEKEHQNKESHSDDEEGNDEEESEDEEEMQDMEESDVERTWRSGQFKPKLFKFNSNDSGISSILPKIDESNPMDYFRLIFDSTLMEKIVEETNRYNVSLMQKQSSPKQGLQGIDTNISEMYTFFALYMLMSHTKKSRIKDYWSTESLISTPIFGSIMSRNRFLSLLRFLHFNDNEQQTTDDNLYKIRPIINHLRDVFGEILVPYQNLCIDESLVLWKGRLSFKQYIPSKRSRFGIKLFLLCDVHTGIILDFIVYTGATTDIKKTSRLGISGSIVMTLLEPYLDQGHNLFVDNWYTSVGLFETLFERSTGACGTVRKNRVNLPDLEEKIGKGQQIYLHTNNLLVLKWNDKKEVMMLSTIHEPQMKYTERHNSRIQKPLSILDYNLNSHAIDKVDMQISFVDCLRKTVKWYRKLFFHMLDLSIFNSYLLYKVNTGKVIKLSDYRLQLIREILQTYSAPKPKIGRPALTNQPIRLTARHFPSLVPQTTERENRQKKCVVCAHTSRRPKKRTDSRYMCRDCDVGLCVVSCFEEYHTVLHF